mmetsp:Transcript_37854/g.61353  ORF Transcript_37854/g.61353 Transcript_37854/m.61353 type:complete len:329 (-) Transcript_37854:145-1131(-)
MLTAFSLAAATTALERRRPRFVSLRNAAQCCVHSSCVLDLSREAPDCAILNDEGTEESLFGNDLATRTKIRKIALSVEQFYASDDPTKHVIWYSNGVLKLLKKSDTRVQEPIFVDFTSGNADFRRRFGSFRNSPFLRAVTIPGIPLNETRVIDATAGFAKDAFVLASYGMHVTMMERHPLMYLLLEDALKRGERDPDVAPVLSRMRLLKANAIEHLSSIFSNNTLQQNGSEDDHLRPPHVVYIDPMYPIGQKRKGSALPKKELAVARAMIGEDSDSSLLLKAARHAAINRVVLKQPVYAQPDPEAAFEYKSKNTRFQVYLPLKGSPAP